MVEEFEQGQEALRNELQCLMSDNKSVEEKLVSLVLQSAENDNNSIDMDAGPSTLLNRVTLDMIKKLLSRHLKPFLHVRFLSTKDISIDTWRRYGITNKQFPNKGKVEDAKVALETDINHNLISLCFKCR
eukprot:11827273-Ditylum_brightwellii.AAC.1